MRSWTGVGHGHLGFDVPRGSVAHASDPVRAFFRSSCAPKPAAAARDSDGRKAPLTALLGTLLVLLVPLSASAGTLVLDDAGVWVPSPELEALEDVAPAATYDWVASRPDADFKRGRDMERMIRPGSASWIRFELHNPRPAPQDIVVEVPFILFDEVGFYFPADGEVRRVDLGPAVKPPQREVPYPLPAAKTRIPAESTRWVYIRFYDQQPGPILVVVRTSDGFRRATNARLLIIGGFVGLALLMFLNNLTMFAIVREPSYAAYAAYVLTVSAYIVCLDGLPLYFEGVGAVQFELICIAFLELGWFCVVHFNQTFLETKTLLPRLHRVLDLAKWSLPLLPFPVYLTVGRGIGQDTVAGCASVLMSLLLITLVSAYRKDARRTRYFAVAWGAWTAIASTFVLGFLGFHTNIVIWEHAPRAAVSVEFVLLSLALADRLNHLKEEKRLALEGELQEARRAARLGETFERYVPKQFLALLERDTILEVRRGDQVELEISILFSDIRGFTTMAEQMGPEKTFRFINEYLGHVEPAIHASSGFINDIFGDGIMALFHTGADDAVAAGLGMLEGLDRLNEQRADDGLPLLRMGMGINTGKLMLGTIGGETRLDCTVVGDPANLAARIEGMTKLYGATMLLSEGTVEALVDRRAYSLRLVDWVQAKGKNEAVRIYEVLDAERGEQRRHKEMSRAAFAEALKLYHAGEFEPAHRAFEACVQAAPQDLAAQLYVQRCSAYAAEPPTDWNGVVRLQHK